MVGGVTFSPSGYWDSYVSGATTPLSGRKLRGEYTSIDEAVTESKKTDITDYVKKGHLWGGVSTGVGALFGYFYTKVESGFWKAILGFISATNILSGLAQVVIATVCKNPEEEKMKQLLPNYITKEDASITLDEMDLEKHQKETLEFIVDKAKKQGVVVNAYGPVGVGKTMSGRAIGGELVKQGACKAAKVWISKDDFLKVETIDRAGKPISIFGYTIVGGETIAQRIERVVANAIKHYKETGEYVVVVLDEAQVLLEGHDMWGDYKYNRSSTDPNDRPQVIQAWAKIVDRVQSETGDCKGVVLVSTSNCEYNPFEFLKRRMEDLHLNRPDEERREQFYRTYIPKFLKKNGLESITLNDNDYKELAKIGTENVFKKYYEHMRTTGSFAYDHLPDYVRPFEEELKKYPMLHIDAMVKGIDKAIFEAKKGGDFLSKLKERLRLTTDEALGRKQAIEDELQGRLKDTISTY